jgi:hypothetical protein
MPGDELRPGQKEKREQGSRTPKNARSISYLKLYHALYKQVKENFLVCNFLKNVPSPSCVRVALLWDGKGLWLAV